jgi:hypothetical protein
LEKRAPFALIRSGPVGGSRAHTNRISGKRIAEPGRGFLAQMRLGGQGDAHGSF